MRAGSSGGAYTKSRPWTDGSVGKGMLCESDKPAMDKGMCMALKERLELQLQRERRDCCMIG